MNYINRIIKHIADGNEYEERMVSIMGGTVEETPSQKLKRLEDEKNILSLFSNGADFELIRKSFSEKIISNERLLELQKSATQKENLTRYKGHLWVINLLTDDFYLYGGLS